MKCWDFGISTKNLQQRLISACCSISDDHISEGCIIPLIAILKSFVRTEWWWSGSIRAVMKLQGAAEGQDLRETKGNIQLLRCYWLPVGMWHDEWLKMLVSGCLWWGLALKQDTAEICWQCAALPSRCVCLYVFWRMVVFEFHQLSHKCWAVWVFSHKYSVNGEHFGLQEQQQQEHNHWWKEYSTFAQVEVPTQQC